MNQSKKTDSEQDQPRQHPSRVKKPLLKSCKNSALYTALFLLFLLDQGLKLLIRSNLAENERIFLSKIDIMHFQNTGIAFSIPMPEIITIILTILILIYILNHLIKRKDPVITLSLGLILTGGLSNFIDRIIHGYTIDYILIYEAVINLADVYILTGIILYVWYNKSIIQNSPK